MKEVLAELIRRLQNPHILEASVIEWGCPIPSFGNLSSSKIATVGLNPSNREFVDSNGMELNGPVRRFHTLNSLGISKWSDVNRDHMHAISELCIHYFRRNPYDSWFKKLDYLISGSKMSYYFPSYEACHLDLIPYATLIKWTELKTSQRTLLFDLAGDSLGLLLKNSSIEIIILNGQTVVDNLQKLGEVKLKKKRMPKWTLPRKLNGGVHGYSYQGLIENFGGVELGRKVVVVGYNHNLQSSYGVTKEVHTAMRSWISNLLTKYL